MGRREIPTAPKPEPAPSIVFEDPMIHRFFRLLFIVVAFAAATSAHADARLLVAVSTEVLPAIQQLADDYRSQYGGPEIALMAGSSRALYADIRRGVPIDLFFAANLSYPARLSDEGLATGAPVIYARNELLLWTRLPGVISPTLDMLTDRKIHVIAIPSRYNSPFGQRAEQALREARLWPKLQAKLVTGENVQEVARFVKNGSASAGIVTRSMLYRSEFNGLGAFSVLPAELYKPIAQAFVMTLHGENNPAVRSFAAFVTGAAARATFVRYGYLPPQDDVAAGK